MTLQTFPEELLERILSLVLVSPNANPKSLLACKTFARIGTPHLYRVLPLRTVRQAALVNRTLDAAPELAECVRWVVLGDGMFAGVRKALETLSSVSSGGVLGIDINVTPGVINDHFGSEDDEEFDELTGSLSRISSIRHLILRKPPTVYTTEPRVKRLMTSLATALQSWPLLESTHILFKLSDDIQWPSVSTSTSVPHSPSSSPPLGSPISASSTDTLSQTITIPQALSASPNLRTFVTYPPACWNVAILTVSENPCVKNLVLIKDGCACFPAGTALGECLPGNCICSAPPPSSSSLFMMFAKRHPRLMALIQAGARSSGNSRGGRDGHGKKRAGTWSGGIGQTKGSGVFTADAVRQSVAAGPRRSFTR